MYKYTDTKATVFSKICAIIFVYKNILSKTL